jgi:KDO2-lipid IV(A) lauroyltransferase
MDTVLYVVARALIAFLQALPLTLVARLGQAGGTLAYWLDTRHRRVAIRNLTQCFGNEMSAREIRTLARRNFRRIGENYACAIRTAAMTREELAPHIEAVDGDRVRAHITGNPPRSVVAAIGHFGNFELYARWGQFVPPIQSATTYRALRPRSVNRLFQELRRRSGCLYFERRRDGAALKRAMSGSPLLLGLLSDQHPGANGVPLPFLGRECAHTAAPAVFALRYNCALFTGFCFRVGLARWRIETGQEIPTHENGQPRSVEAITADIVKALEAGVRRDPANWFWVHNRWKPVEAKAARRSPNVESEEIQTP